MESASSTDEKSRVWEKEMNEGDKYALAQSIANELKRFVIQDPRIVVSECKRASEQDVVHAIAEGIGRFFG